MTSYTTIAEKCGPFLFKDRKSKFLGYAFPVTSVDEAKLCLSELRNDYPDATHLCYAYKIGLKQPEIRMNDDGEPSYSAGSPIYGQLEAFGLDNVLICVIRYYGGTKLGVGGLIQAYKETARLCLEGAKLLKTAPSITYQLDFEYSAMDAVMRCIAQNQFQIVSQNMSLTCQIILQVKEEQQELLPDLFHAISGVKISSE